MYTLHCRYGGRDFDLAWEDGELTGDPNALLVLESLAQVYEEAGESVGPPAGPMVYENFLADEWGALWLALRAFEVVGTEGDVPTRAPVPEGVVA